MSETKRTMITTSRLVRAKAAMLPTVISLALCSTARGGELANTHELEAAVAQGVARLLEMQEGENGAEWPYEGVYRVQGEIPIGYRVGGTGIVAAALLHAPGLADDPDRREAIHRAARFIIASIDHPLMAHKFNATYDVRGWGYAYGLWYLLRAKSSGEIPPEEVEAADRAIRFFIDGIAATEIPRFGGWNYARRAGFDTPAAPSPFMTGATLQALFEARAAGYEIDAAVIERGLQALVAAKLESGGYVYSGRAGARSRDGLPGAVGRMLIAECTLRLADRASAADVRGALDAFIVHWEWLEKRRAQHGTHVAPYGIAPYYFFFAHLYAAQAIELLPEGERAEYRRRLRELLDLTCADDGTWNDRVFPRSANYGTAMALLALMMPELPAPARWSPPNAQE